MKTLTVTVLIDNLGSYLYDYVDRLMDAIKEKGHDAILTGKVEDVRAGDVLFILGCNAILGADILSRNAHNIVVHPSKLPEGRGSAALVNKILEGEDTVWLTLFEAVAQVDAGDYYYQEPITFEGHELSDEIRKKQTMKVFELALRFLDDYERLEPKKQEGESTFYKRRTPKDSKLDIDTTIREQFNLLRVCDNERYPAFFEHLGHTYVVRIEKKK